MPKQSSLENVAGKWKKALEAGDPKAGRDARRFERLQGADPELARLLEEVLESRSTATEWLTSSNRALGGELPLSLLSSGRRQEVVDSLIRLEYGVYQ